MGRAIELEDRLLRMQGMVNHRQCGKKLERCGLGDCRSPHVRVELHSVRLRDGGDVLRRREAAAGTEVWLRNVDRARAEELAEAVERVLVLAAGDRRGKLLA